MPIRPASNRYVIRSRLTEKKFLKLLDMFLDGKQAAQVAAAIDIDRNTANAYIHALRRRVAEFCDEYYRPKEMAGLKVEHTFVNTRSDKRFSSWSRTGRSRVEAYGRGGRNIKKTKVLIRPPRHFAIKVLGEDRVWTALIPKLNDFNYLYRAEEHLSRSGTWKQWLAFDGIAGYGDKKLLRILKTESSPEVRAFWYELVSSLKKRRGTNDKSFYYHLKEAEFRHNTVNEESPSAIIANELLKSPLRLDLTRQ